MLANNISLYTTIPVKKAVITLTLPTILSQLITVVYNIADTFFIGKMNDPAQVAAVSLTMTPMVLTLGIANLFGIGGSSLMSRCLGQGNREKARNCAVFSFWAAGITAAIYGIFIMLFRPVVLPIIGATDDTYVLCYQYLFWTLTIGAVPSVLSMTTAHLFRAEGYSKEASIGIVLGGSLNIVLDPIFIFLFRMELEGAAIATMLSNVASMIYFLVLLYKKRSVCVISINLKHFTLGKEIPFETLLVGLPSCLITFLSVFSNAFLNNLMSNYSTEALAGLGIAKKIDMFGFAIESGITQGVLSLIAFNYSAKNYKRMMAVLKATIQFALIMALPMAILIFIFAAPIAKMFIEEPNTLSFSIDYLRTICLTRPSVVGAMIIIAIFQAMGKKVHPTVMSFIRKGSVDVILMVVLNHFLGASGIVLAIPISEVIIFLIALALFIPTFKQLRKQSLIQGEDNYDTTCLPD